MAKQTGERIAEASAEALAQLPFFRGDF